MSDRPSPYDAGLGPVSNSPGKLESSRKCAADYERKVVSDVLDAWIHQREHGFDLEHDLSHNDGDLSRAAADYALHGTHYAKANGLPSLWPWGDGCKPRDRRENLVRAAALLLSEIVRFDAEKGPFGSEDRP